MGETLPNVSKSQKKNKKKHTHTGPNIDQYGVSDTISGGRIHPVCLLQDIDFEEEEESFFFFSLSHQTNERYVWSQSLLGILFGLARLMLMLMQRTSLRFLAFEIDV